MKKERLAQIVLVIVGLLNLALIYFLYMDLRKRPVRAVWTN